MHLATANIAVRPSIFIQTLLKGAKDHKLAYYRLLGQELDLNPTYTLRLWREGTLVEPLGRDSQDLKPSGVGA